MKVLDLFSGLGGWSNPFKEAGHEVRTLDYDPKFGATYPIDIRTFAADPDAYAATGKIGSAKPLHRLPRQETFAPEAEVQDGR